MFKDKQARNDILNVSNVLSSLVSHLGLKIVLNQMTGELGFKKETPAPKPRKKRKAKKVASFYDSSPYDMPVKKRGRPRKTI